MYWRLYYRRLLAHLYYRRLLAHLYYWRLSAHLYVSALISALILLARCLIYYTEKNNIKSLQLYIT
jgi:hypothetical protein